MLALFQNDVDFCSYEWIRRMLHYVALERESVVQMCIQYCCLEVIAFLIVCRFLFQWFRHLHLKRQVGHFE